MNKSHTKKVWALLFILLLVFTGCSFLKGSDIVKTTTPEIRTDTAEGLSKAEREDLEKIKKSALRDTGSAAGADYLIGGNDVLSIKVYDEKDLRFPALRVSPDGYLSFPLIGRFKAAGMTTAQLEELMARKLSAGYLLKPQVSVQLKEFNSRYFVLGEVKKPGAYTLTGSDISLVEGISIAGGFTNFAAGNSTKIIRNQNGQEIVIRVKVDDITKAGTQMREIVLQPNDIVIVPQSFF